MTGFRPVNYLASRVCIHSDFNPLCTKQHNQCVVLTVTAVKPIYSYGTKFKKKEKKKGQVMKGFLVVRVSVVSKSLSW